MKERPIIFSAPMVRAILEERKTQTRRIVKPQPSEGWRPFGYGLVHKMKDGDFVMRNDEPVVIGWGASNEEGDEAYKCPHGQPGDRLWVKEACAYAEKSETLIYRATTQRDPKRIKWKSPLFMRRDESRILLEITGIRIKRLQETNGVEAAREGVRGPLNPPYDVDVSILDCARREFVKLWESLHGPGAWDENPWVWVISFRRI
jgi:hypothetical protein